jgi:hypothetical protein
VKDIHTKFVVIIEGFLDLKERLYKFYDFPKKYLRPNELVAHIKELEINGETKHGCWNI